MLRRAPWTMRIWYRRVYGPLIGLAADGVGRAQRLQAVAAEHRLPRLVRPHGAAADRPVRDPRPNAPPADPAARRKRRRRASQPRVPRGPARADHAAGRTQPPRRGGRRERPRCARPLRGAAGARPRRGASRADECCLPSAVRLRGARRRSAGSARSPSPARSSLATTPISALGGRTLAEEVARRLQTSPSDSRLGDLKAFQAALTRLAKADPADVDPALRSYLGACSHRLDAWLTSLATWQLDVVRKERPTGTHLGGYGYVENLQPEATADSLGYVLGPSVAHAAAAGLLRSGYLAQQGSGADNLDVDLSSERVEGALELMRGVVEGVPLSVLLGYRLERALRDADLSVLILPLRTVFPLRTPSAPDGPATPVESVPPNNVVDAAQLLERWKSGRAGVLQDVRAAANLPADDPKLAGSRPRSTGSRTATTRSRTSCSPRRSTRSSGASRSVRRRRRGSSTGRSRRSSPTSPRARGRRPATCSAASSPCRPRRRAPPGSRWPTLALPQSRGSTPGSPGCSALPHAGASPAVP